MDVNVSKGQFMKLIKKIGYGLLVCQLSMAPLKASAGEGDLLFHMDGFDDESFSQPRPHDQTDNLDDETFEGWASDDGADKGQLYRAGKVDFCELMGLKDTSMLASFESFDPEESASSLVFAQVSTKLGSYFNKEIDKKIQAMATWRVIYGHAFLGFSEDQITHVLSMNGSDHIYMMSALSIPLDSEGFHFFTSLMVNIVDYHRNQQPRSGSCEADVLNFSVHKTLLETVLTKMQGSGDNFPPNFEKDKFIQNYIGIVNGEHPPEGEELLKQYVLKYVAAPDTTVELRDDYFKRFCDTYKFLAGYMIEKRDLFVADLGLYKIDESKVDVFA